MRTIATVGVYGSSLDDFARLVWQVYYDAK